MLTFFHKFFSQSRNNYNITSVCILFVLLFKLYMSRKRLQKNFKKKLCKKVFTRYIWILVGLCGMDEIENDNCQFQAMDSYPGGFVLFRNLVKSPVNFSNNQIL